MMQNCHFYRLKTTSYPPFYYMYKARICVVLQTFSNNDKIFGNRTTMFLRNFNPRLHTALTFPMDHIWCDSDILGSRKRDCYDLVSCDLYTGVEMCAT